MEIGHQPILESCFDLIFDIRLMCSHDTTFVETTSKRKIGSKIWQKIVLCEQTLTNISSTKNSLKTTEKK